MAQVKVSGIWWRNVQLGEFYNIERHHQIKSGGGGGALYIEIPKSIVAKTLDFLDVDVTRWNAAPSINTIQARVHGRSSESGPIEFRPKSGGRMLIARQNRRQPNSQRHPAWTAANDFPTAPNDIADSEQARPYFPNGGLRIYIIKSIEGDFYAGFTKGLRPASMQRRDPAWDLYTQNGVGGVIYAD